MPEYICELSKLESGDRKNISLIFEKWVCKGLGQYEVSHLTIPTILMSLNK